MKITISGIGGVGKGTTAKILAEKLDYQVVSGGNFARQLAKDLNMTLPEFEIAAEGNKEYDLKIDGMQEKFGKENNNFIMESRLGFYFVPDSFKIQLVCEEKERIKRIGGRDEKNTEYVKKNEKERLVSVHKRYLEYYNLKNFQDKKYFDLVVDTTNNSPEEVVKIILENLKKNKL